MNAEKMLAMMEEVLRYADCDIGTGGYENYPQDWFNLRSVELEDIFWGPTLESVIVKAHDAMVEMKAAEPER